MATKTVTGQLRPLSTRLTPHQADRRHQKIQARATVAEQLQTTSAQLGLGLYATQVVLRRVAIAQWVLVVAVLVLYALVIARYVVG